jgi:hypothetical protein
MHEVSLLSQYQVNPRVGHLEALYHVFAYMKSHLDIGRVAFDPKTPVVDKSAFNNGADWKEFYGEVQEELPPKMPKPRGQRVTISAFVDANHAGNKVTRRSHTGIIIYVQNAPILWYSKRQNTVEAATFGSEMVALWICKELIVAIHYKLRMFGVEVDGPANVFCDNRGVVRNVSIGRSIDEGGYGSEEMGFLLLFILLSWSNSQVILAARCYGITSHAGRKRSEAL